MSDTTIEITKREAASTRANKRLRKQDVIPGVLYGQGREPLPIQVERVKLRAAFAGDAGRNAILSLSIAGEKEPVNAILKAMEIDRVRDRVTHVDLMAISMTETITAPVPVHLEGEAEGVKLDGGMIEHALHEVLVTALPGKVPTEIVVDISALRIGHSIHVRDLVAGGDFEFGGDPDATICSCVVTRAALSTAETGEEGEEGVEGAEGEGGEGGEAPAAEGDAGGEAAGDDSSE
ncbi:MAG: 50S ribosomal protein L25, partial [Gaiellales bacterium]